MTRPNVLLICCDDLGYGDIGSHGAEYATPNIDRLVDEGVELTDWHSNGPICSPTRASLLTGRYPHRARVPGNVPQGHPNTDPGRGLPTDQPTLATVFSDAGYRTAAIGKWHLGMTERDDPLAHGFDEFFGFRSGCVDYYTHLQMWVQHHGVPPYHDLWEDRTEVWHNGEYATDLITDRTVEFVGGDEPFFGYVAYNAPHYPLHAPSKYFERVDHLSGDRRRHAAMVSALDDGVGRVLDALDRNGVASETIVLFTSDHGPSREVRNHFDGTDRPYRGGSTGGHRGHKFSLFEGGLHIPGAIRYPDGFDSGERDALALTMDVFPTVLDLCGLDPPSALDGRTLRGVLVDGDPSPHERVYWAFDGQLAVREGPWKLVVDGVEIPPGSSEYNQIRADGRRLFHLGDDPGENCDRSHDRTDLSSRLATAGREWRRDR